MKIYKDLCELIVETKGKPTAQQLLDIGYTMEHFILMVSMNVRSDRLVQKANDYLGQLELMDVMPTEEWIKKGFDRIGFKDYLIKKIPGHMDHDALSHFLLYIDKIVDYGLSWEHVSKDQLAGWFAEMVPELEIGEAAMFIADSSLTDEMKYTKRETYRELVEM